MTILDSLDEADFVKYKQLKLESLEQEPLAFSPGIEVYKDYYEADWVRESKRIQSGPNRMFFVEHNGQIIAMAGICMYEQNLYKHNAQLQALYVSKEFRGQGLGSQLMQARIDHCINSDITNIICEIVSSQTASLKLHEKFGFEIVGRYKDFVKYNDQYFDNIYLQRSCSKAPRVI